MDLEITAKKTTPGAGEIMIFGPIADFKWSDEDVTAKSFDTAVKDLGDVNKVHIRINCFGGSVHAGNAIAAIIDNLRSKSVRVTSKVEGIAASMGTVIPQATDEISMSENALFIIHRPQTGVWGNIDDLKDAEDLLEKAYQTMVSLYKRRFKGTDEELDSLLKGRYDGVTLTAQEALDYGFIDRIDKPVQIAAYAGGVNFNGMKVPTATAQLFADKIKLPEYNKNKGGEEVLYDKDLDAAIKSALDSGKAITLSNEGDSPAVKVIDVSAAQNEVVLEGYDVSDLVAVADKFTEIGVKLPEAIAYIEEKKSVTEKAEKFDQIQNAAIVDALKSGVRAIGDSFDEKRWKKILSNFTVSEINSQKEEWNKLAENEFHAGDKRKSSQLTQSSLPVNPEVYKV